MLWGILTFGVLGWVGFAYIGLKAKSARWLIMASVLLAAFIALSAIPVESSNEWMHNIIIPVMLASIALAFFENRTWLRFRAEQAPTRPWFEQGVEPDSLSNVVPSPAEIAGPLPQMGISEPYFAHAPSPAVDGAGAPTVDSLLDVNAATHSDLLTLPGFDEPTAERVITSRDSIGGFKSIPDFESAAKLPPHLLVRVRKLVECRRTHTSNSALQSGMSKPSLGRQVDL